jgi:hypothetical protein
MPEFTHQVMQIRKKIEDQLNNSLKEFIGLPATEENRYQIEQTVADIVNRIYSETKSDSVTVSDIVFEKDIIKINFKLSFPMVLEFDHDIVPEDSPLRKIAVSEFSMSRNLLRPDGKWKIEL